MQRKDRIDMFGAVSLTGFALFLAINQVVIKLVNEGLQPAFFAGARSALAVLCLWAFMAWRGRPPRLSRAMAGPGLLIGLCFSAEFLLLFLALDLTTVTRSAILFYSMPVWMALGAHLWMPGERIGPAKALGLGLALAGVAWALLDRAAGAPAPGQAPSLLGDLCALGAALGWAGTALMTRLTRLRHERPEMQLYWQVLVSAPVLLLAAPLFGPLIRDLQPVHIAGLLFHAVAVVSAGFMFWLWLLSIYPVSSVASFSFLSPVFSVGLGWALLGEQVGPSLIGALVLVAAGIVLINRPRRAVAL